MDRCGCLYKILDLSRDCSPEDIRSAYRRLALKLHPDKIATTNGGVTTPAATAAFQELLHAYTILSDPHERDNYDSKLSDPDEHSYHEDESYSYYDDESDYYDDDESSSTSTVKSPFPFFNIDFLSYFTDSAFHGFTDSGQGFYKVYGDLFINIYAFELRFGAASPAPKFGNIDSPYSQVEAFYKFWLSFSTVLNFGGKLTPNSKVNSLWEEKNKNSLWEEKNKKAKNEHNDLVRSLAAFARKRDKRLIDTQAKKKPEVEEEKRCDNKSQRKEAKKKPEVEEKRCDNKAQRKEAKKKPEANKAQRKEAKKKPTAKEEKRCDNKAQRKEAKKKPEVEVEKRCDKKAQRKDERMWR